MEVIHADLRIPSKKSKRPFVYSISCSAESCELRDRGECELMKIFAEGCPHGRASRQDGPTRRARSYSQWIRDSRERCAKAPALKMPEPRLARCGDHFWLPYPFMRFDAGTTTMPRVPAWRSLSSMLPAEALTVDLMRTILDYRPQALMGGEITDYQKKDVPAFLQHLSEQEPELWATMCEAIPSLVGRVARASAVGRKAILSTLTPNVGEFGGRGRVKWKWDGEWLSSEGATVLSSPIPLSADAKMVKVQPPDGLAVEVTDDRQVNEGTEFVT